MAKTADQILTDLKGGAYAPIYFLHGEEPYFIDIISDFIEKNALNEAEKSFNQRILYAKDVSLNNVISAARSFPMMGQRQVIIVKEAQELAELKKGDTGMEVFEAYLQNPQPSTVLVFCHKHKKIDKRKKISKLIEKNTVFLESNKIYENKVPDWIQQYVSGKGYKINRDATMLLTEYIGNNLERMSNEIDKILINFKEPVEIDSALVQEYVGISKDYNIFELQKALVTGNVLQANRIIQYFAADPKNHPVILSIGFLHSFFTKLLLIHNHPDKSDRGVAMAAGVSPYIAKEYMAAVRRFNLNKVVQNLAYIYQADLTSKGINASLAEDQLMKELVYKLMH
ncbi:DNA polymerase III subunit delta [Marivirga sp. S37H4]|uniref:DNA polymerase III subunit delta n=1 Tax=Marivirga aurantiaca TaxID=2802615 RepID=A0A934WWM1_9BACT|nr:DNA polymerase III subunit delta [Marivirga aurantiaca]MBK6264226.1 DNA polymerase III subunit delta [Marivirga aurantiaca]